MSKIEQTEKPSLVRSFSEQSPTLPFVMRRRKEDGSIEEFPFRVQLMRSANNFDILSGAQRTAKEKKELEGYQDIYREAQAVELVRQCMCHDTKSPSGRYLPYFVTSQQVRESLDETEIAQVINCYEITKSYFGFGSDVDEETVESLIDKLADEFQGPFFLSQFASEDWPRLIYTLACLALSWRPESDPTLSDSPSTSESSPETSQSGTGGSSELPDAQSTGGFSNSPIVPKTDRIMTREEAREAVRRATKKPK